MIIRLLGFFFVLHVFLMIDIFFSVSRTILEPMALVVASLTMLIPVKRFKPLEEQTLSVFKSSLVVVLGMLLMGGLFLPIVFLFG
ncbi:hypothetical protein [Exiguobacterium acetylicum]|uniref:hypothetical protein n=1 Tax=Exiguobacterium acetylicum TaxID=41170 RepID=UPI001CA6BCA1|nr:hypothetical protein [Exiguobacterium acetylicum]QZY88056.1 hypothetical protein K7G97_06870 [Exiguobacterium acetylicum]